MVVDISTLLLPFGITLAVGFLIGAERESLRLHADVKILAGLRTFLFVSVWGFLSAVLEKIGMSPFFLVSFGLLVMLVTVAQWMRSVQQNMVGLTTAMALILTFMLGGLTVFFDPRLVLALGVIIALILSFKSSFTHVLGIIPRDAVLATVQFAVLSAAVLPFLPNSYIDPWQFLNPYIAWWVVVLISGVSFVGYMLHLLLGNRSSVLLTAAVGGLVSSTAVTTTIAHLSKKTSLSDKLLLSGCVLTSSVAAVRIWITTTTVNHAMFMVLIAPVLTFVLIGAFFIWLWQHRETTVVSEQDVGGFENPFQLKTALGFALFFIFIAFIAKESTALFGSKGLYFTSVFAGLADIDAISLSISQLLAHGAVSAGQAIVAVVTAFLSNMWVKWLIIALFATKQLRRYLLRYTLVITVGGLISSLLFSHFYFN